MGTCQRQLIHGGFFFACVGFLLSPGISQADDLYEQFRPAQLKIGHVGFQPKWEVQWFPIQRTTAAGYWDASISRGLFPANVPQFQHASYGTVQDIGLTAILRYQSKEGSGFYAEAGTGPYYQSISYGWASRTQSSRLAMNSLAGVGFVWKNGVDLGFKAVHVTRGLGVDGGEGERVVGVGLRYRW